MLAKGEVARCIPQVLTSAASTWSHFIPEMNKIRGLPVVRTRRRKGKYTHEDRAILCLSKSRFLPASPWSVLSFIFCMLKWLIYIFI